MTDSLIRISCSETGDFSKLMLAPGLPMLDGKMLTYQVLQGWLGDLLAEPSLDGDTVVFHVHVDGLRQAVVSRSFATPADLKGALAHDYERLRKALFDVKPVSPSERLIFSRLQPPVGDSEGFLFNVKTEDGIDRLVWCWGYQRRVSDGPLGICPESKCAAMFVKQGGAAEMCPLCGEQLAKPQIMKSSKSTHRRRRPIGALIASGTLLCAALGTYFYAATATTDVESDDSLINGLEARPIAASERAPQSLTVDTPPDVVHELIDEPQPEIPPETLRTEDDRPRKLLDGPELPMPDSKIAQTPISKESASNPSIAKNSTPLPDFKPFKLPEIPSLDPAPNAIGSNDNAKTQPPTTLPNVIAPEPPQVAIVPKSNPTTKPKSTNSKEPGTLIPIEPKAAAKNEPRQPRLPVLPPLDPLKVDPPTTDLPQKSDLSKSPTSTNPPVISILPPESIPSKPSEVTLPKKSELPEFVKIEPKGNSSNPEPRVTNTPQKTVGERQWHQDYLAAYQQAITDKQMLVMLFHDASNPDLSETRTSGFGAPELQEQLDNFSRVTLPINFVAPSADSNAPVTRLIEHRSFRHLRGQAGIAIVDLTDAQGPNYGRVVSALPLPSDGRFSPEVLGTLLQLPSGSIGQRSIVLAIRTGVTGDNFTTGESNPQLHQLANRNARLMAQAEQAGSYDQTARVTAIRESFGDGIRIGELLFATDGPATVQEAAIQAVSKWMQSPEDQRVLNATSFAYGIELFQSPTSQRWFATCIALSR